jgi:hypothetical protein
MTHARRQCYIIRREKFFNIDKLLIFSRTLLRLRVFYIKKNFINIFKLLLKYSYRRL